MGEDNIQPQMQQSSLEPQKNPVVELNENNASAKLIGQLKDENSQLVDANNALKKQVDKAYQTGIDHGVQAQDPIATVVEAVQNGATIDDIIKSGLPDKVNEELMQKGTPPEGIDNFWKEVEKLSTTKQPDLEPNAYGFPK